MVLYFCSNNFLNNKREWKPQCAGGWTLTWPYLVRNAKDLELLERLQLGNDNEDEIPPLEHGLELLDLRDSDDETYDPANPDEDDYF